jgi:hypothetical protein
MYEQPTAREQFARDCMLVLENTRPAYEHIMKKAKRLNANGEPVNLTTYQLAEFIKNYFEQSISDGMRYSVSDSRSGVGELLIAQLCIGWGIDPFYDMARDFMTAAAESAGV